jgi:hypothetical protein
MKMKRRPKNQALLNSAVQMHDGVSCEGLQKFNSVFSVLSGMVLLVGAAIQAQKC